MNVPFCKPFISGKELDYIKTVIYKELPELSGNGEFTAQCHTWLNKNIGCMSSLLTHSCTAALEMSAMLINIIPGDEIIMPSYTFVSTANAFALRGAIPVFVDIDPKTLNINPSAIEEAITDRTRAICAVHYAGVSCDMDALQDIATRYDIYIIEDAAQAILSYHNGRPLGSIGDIGALSFHATKNVISGEGGALLINNKSFINKAEIIWEKGTDRREYARGNIDKYTWQDLGSSFLPSEIVAAFLYAQLEAAHEATDSRMVLWDSYHKALHEYEYEGLLKRPDIPAYATHNAHMYYIILESTNVRNELLMRLRNKNIMASTHYIPLHSSPGGRRYGRLYGSMENTETISNTLLRLPIWPGMSSTHLDFVCTNLIADLSECRINS